MDVFFFLQIWSHIGRCKIKYNDQYLRLFNPYTSTPNGDATELYVASILDCHGTSTIENIQQLMM